MTWFVSWIEGRLARLSVRVTCVCVLVLGIRLKLRLRCGSSRDICSSRSQGLVVVGLGWWLLWAGLEVATVGSLGGLRC